MGVTGAVLLDLRDVDPERAHHRVDALRLAPDGARVLLVVGALKPNPRIVDLAHRHADRLDIEVQGQPHAVHRWVDALRTGTALPLTLGAVT